MAKPKKILVLDLGMQSLRLAEFSIDKNGELTLSRGASREFLLDPSMEQSRPEQIKLSVQEILKDWGLKSADDCCILPAHSVFTRVVPLDIPGGSGGLKDRIEEVIQFEAQQNIPFPLDEVAWDYVTMGETASGAVNVVFVAVKSDLLESICQSLRAAGLIVVSVTAAPLALYDAFRNTYPESSDTTTLLLDMGSRTTNLLIAGPGTFFARSIPSGGLALTAAIAKELNAELEAAEQLKITHGSVSSGSATEKPADHLDAGLALIIRRVMLKTQSDISRSLSFYLSSQGGQGPSRILLTGGMASLPGLREFLSEKFLRDVQLFDPLRTLTIREQSSTVSSFIESHSNNLGELIGGALTLSGESSFTKVELLPRSLMKRREFFKRLPFLSGAAALFLINLATWSGYFSYVNGVTKAQTSVLSGTMDKETRLASGIRQVTEKTDTVQKTASELLSLIELRSAYPNLIADLSAKIPDRYLWITEIQPVGDAPQKNVSGATGTNKISAPTVIRALIVKGLYLENPRQAAVIDDFVNSLQSSDLFSVNENEKSKIITQRGSPNGDQWAYPFALKIPLRNSLTFLP